MKKILECPQRKLGVRLLFCYTLVLLHFVHGFSPVRTVAKSDAMVQIGNSKVEEPTMRIRQRRIISTTTSLSSTKHQPSHNKLVLPTTGSSAVATDSLNPVEAWCTTHMNVWYDKSLSLKCPFFRRRMTDFLDGVDMIMRFLVIRHKSLDLIGPPPGCRSFQSTKHTNLELDEIVETIRSDWKPDHDKGYYITGRLNTTIYRDDCWFTGPDPDMPVRGVRKYLNAASQLFDKTTSTAELLELKIGDVDLDLNGRQSATIVARWKLKGVLHLPWHPSLPVWTGSTTYHLDDEHMIYRHEEQWDISVFRAFTQTLWPELGNILWKTKIVEEDATTPIR